MKMLIFKQISQLNRAAQWAWKIPRNGPSSTFHTSAVVGAMNSSRQRLHREAYYKKRDHIADDYNLVYRAPMDLTIAGCKHLATISLAVAGACIAIKVVANETVVNTTNLQLAFGPLLSETDDLLWFSAAFIAFNVTLLFACRSYPLRIYRKKNSCVAMFEGMVPMSAKAFPFSAGELRESFNGVLPWKDSMYKIRRRPVLLLTQYFKTPGDLNEMMTGVDLEVKIPVVKKKY